MFYVSLITISVLFFALFSINISANAQSNNSDINLSVAPQSFEIKAQKGEMIKDKIKIYNRGANPVALEAIVDDFGAAEESGTINFGNIPDSQIGGENAEDVSQWIKISNPNFILDPGEQDIINFTITVPKNVSDGGKYAVIFFEPRMSAAATGDKSSVKVLPKVGVLFLLSVGNVAPGKAGEMASIAEFNIPENFHLKRLENMILGATGLFNRASAEEKSSFSIVENGEMFFTLRLKNNDIYHIKPEGKLVIASGGGKFLGETKISPTTILPGKIRQIPLNFEPDKAGWIHKHLPVAISEFISRNFIWGKYEAKLFLNVSGGVIEKNIEFWIFPWKTAAILFILMIVIVLMRKRLIMAGKVLFMKREA